MPFVSASYKTNIKAPVGQWACTRTSSLEPFSSHPPAGTRSNPDCCGQCVSFITTACPSLPASTLQWKMGRQVRGNTAIVDGTVIATFNTLNHYHGHAPIHVRQDHVGICVYDQWITGAGKGIGPRLIKWNGHGVSNNGEGFHVVEP
jgi:hypothetical protein